MKIIRALFLVLLAMMTILASAKTKIIAHRGYWKTEGSAQNSIASLTKADSLGVYGSEMDVWLTKDNKLIVNHDAIFKGCDIEKSTRKKVVSIILSNGEHIPTLQQYLNVVRNKPKTRLILEMKVLNSKDREKFSVKKIAKLLKKFDVAKQTDLISFSLDACKEFKKQVPDAKIFYLNGDLTPSQIVNLGFAGIDYSSAILTLHPEWIKEAHDFGLEVNVWTIDDPKEMMHFISLGVDYITTNEPVQLIKLLKDL